MKKSPIAKKIMVLCLSGIMLALGACNASPLPEQSPSPTPSEPIWTDSDLLSYENLVAQTGFSYPRSWEYQEDMEYEEQLEAIFLAENGTQIGVQFLWMDQEAQQKNVFLEQLDVDDVHIEDSSQGVYSGRHLSGRDRQLAVEAYELSRSWYDTPYQLYIRLTLVTEETHYPQEGGHFQALLQSLYITDDSALQKPSETDWALADFEAYGFSFHMPAEWGIRPEYLDDGGQSSIIIPLIDNNEIVIGVGNLDESGLAGLASDWNSYAPVISTYGLESKSEADSFYGRYFYQGQIVEYWVGKKDNAQFYWVELGMRPVVHGLCRPVVERIIVELGGKVL